MDLSKRLMAEAIGTFWLVLGGCGSAILATGVPGSGIGSLGVSFAFGLTVVTGAYALGRFSGAHFNPAITVGLATAGRFPRQEVSPYIISQMAGAVVASIMLYMIASGHAGFDPARNFATNGYGLRSPGEYSLISVLLTEMLLTCAFVYIVLEVTSQSALQNFAPLVIGLTLTLIHLISIPVSNTSVNPARSTGPALIAGGAALAQLWVFWLAPFLGGIAAGIFYRWFNREKGELAPELISASEISRIPRRGKPGSEQAAP